MVEQGIPICVMDCDVAAAFDNVSHHLITDAMKALKVPLVLVAVWIREYRSSETYVKLDDILTPGVRRKCDLFGAALDVPATGFCKKVPSRQVGAARGC